MKKSVKQSRVSFRCFFVVFLLHHAAQSSTKIRNFSPQSVPNQSPNQSPFWSLFLAPFLALFFVPFLVPNQSPFKSPLSPHFISFSALFQSLVQSPNQSPNQSPFQSPFFVSFLSPFSSPFRHFFSPLFGLQNFRQFPLHYAVIYLHRKVKSAVSTACARPSFNNYICLKKREICCFLKNKNTIVLKLGLYCLKAFKSRIFC